MDFKMDKWLEENKLEYHSLTHLEKYINGNFTRTKKGTIKYPIEISEVILKDEVEGIPLNAQDYKLIPMLLFVREKD